MSNFNKFKKSIKKYRIYLNGGAEQIRTKYTNFIIINGKKLFLIFEKLTNNNLQFWKSYTKEQKKNKKILQIKENRLNIDIGLDTFIESINLYSYDPPYSIWIAYVSIYDINTEVITEKHKLISDDFSISDIRFLYIIMSLTIFTQNHVPISTHIGIFKSIYIFEQSVIDKINKILQEKRYLFQIENYPNLSMILHGFSAYITKTNIDNGIIYMVTKPVEKMLQIFEKNFNDYDLNFWVENVIARLDYLDKKLEDSTKIYKFKNNDKNTHIYTPLDDTQETFWTITLPNYITLPPFTPKWIIHEPESPDFIHNDMAPYSIPTIIVNIDDLSTFFVNKKEEHEIDFRTEEHKFRSCNCLLR